MPAAAVVAAGRSAQRCESIIRRGTVPPSAAALDEELATRHVRAWYFLVVTVGLHVLDEATTGFLGFYNPLILRIRAEWPRFPMPTFTFRVWFTGLILLVLVLALLGPLVRRGAAGTRALSGILSAIMLLNGLGHLVGSVYFARWLPGATSAPLLLIASAALATHAWRRGRPGGTETAERAA